ncbi:MAG: hypothetical protein JXN65_03370 [Clostridia bacterium]|nr:hypothetical protein [Clostridia bacterium]
MNDKQKWYKLDTSAKIYPALESLRNPSIFRVSVTLREQVNPDLLLHALKNIRGRFPYYNVHMKHGLFWSYLEHNNNEPIIWKDSQSPCRRITPIFNNGFLYKIKYFNKKIALDMFHVLTDGYGAMEFLKCILAEYLLQKNEISDIDSQYIIDKNEIPAEEESEDAFLKVLEEHKDELPAEKKRSLMGKKTYFKMKGKMLPHSSFQVVTGLVSAKSLKEISARYEATVTQLIVSLYLEALIHVQAKQVKNKEKHLNISVQLPVNMRRFYPKKCMRNFSLFVIPYIDPRETKNFQSIVDEVKDFMKAHLTTDHLLTMVEDNCSIAANFFVRHVPLFLKNIIIRFMNNTAGSTQFSVTLSNLGVVKLPENMEEHIDYFNMVLGPSIHNKCTCSMVSFNDKAAITFEKTIKSSFIAEYVFKKLVEMGAAVEIKSNY